MDLADENGFDDELRGICSDLETGKNQLVDTIESGKLKDEKLMQISLGVQDDIEMTLTRWNDVKNGKKPQSFKSSFLNEKNNNDNGFNKNKDNMGNNKSNNNKYNNINNLVSSENKNYVKKINLDLRTTSYERKYKRLVNKLDDWTQQIQDANVLMDMANENGFDDELRGICNDLETGKR